MESDVVDHQNANGPVTRNFCIPSHNALILGLASGLFLAAVGK